MSAPEISSPAQADDRYAVVVTGRGPYLVYGHPPFAAQHIMPDLHGESWFFRQGRSFSTASEPTALCRCGASGRKPYCDGSHTKADWDPALTAPPRPLSEGAERTEGPGLTLEDNPAYCVFARFCRPFGDAWSLTERSGDEASRRLAVREASICPGGRLTARDRATGRAYEYRFEPGLGLVEDPAIGASGGLWVRGGIPIRREDGTAYEVRNRVVLCRCGRSANKPYCDGSHAAVKWRDGIEDTPVGATVPEEVY